MNLKSLCQSIITLFYLFCICLNSDNRLVAQDSTSLVHVGNKSKLTAGALAYLVPGLGHVYAGRPARGVGFFASEVVIVGAIFVGKLRIGDDATSDYPKSVNVALYGSLIALRIWEYVDLFKCIDERNKMSLSMGIIPFGHQSCALSLQYKF